MIAPLEPSRLRAAAAMLARSFDDDPVSLYLFPGARRRRWSLRSFMEAAVRDALHHGEVWAATDGSRVQGIAAWLPEGAYPPSTRRQARQFGAVVVSLLTPSTVPRGARLVAQTQSAHPKDPHWYLAVLGVEPADQGRGLGRRLLEPVLERLDREERAAYLETSKERNVTWYGRERFELTRTLDVWPGGPPMWTMWRAAKSPES
ncbi:MAG TPA: GNAT family N-acetyltransferase [Acidimicrobiia bacterium]